VLKKERQKMMAQGAIACISQLNPSFTAKEVQAEVGGTASSVSVDTIKRTLRRAGLKSYRPCASPHLDAAKRATRLKWCREHEHWSREQWRKVSLFTFDTGPKSLLPFFLYFQVIFSDETYFDVDNVVHSQYVRRKPAGRITLAHTTSRRAFLQRVLFWGCISGDQGRGPLVSIDGTMKTTNYKDTLSHHLLPFFLQHQPQAGVIFQQDNAPCHKSRVTMAFLTESNIPVMNWPPYSPDLSPIENLWGIMSKKIRKRAYQSKEELRAAVNDAWNDPDMSSLCQKICDSMCDRVAACIAARGGYIPY
jgi:transposase